MERNNFNVEDAGANPVIHLIEVKQAKALHTLDLKWWLSPLPTFQASAVRGEDTGEEGPQALIQVLWTTIGIEGAPSTTPGRGPRSEVAMKSSVVFAGFYESLSP